MPDNADTIFLLRDGGTLERVPQADYDSEDLLQKLLDDYPELLAGEQIQPEDPVRWLPLTREAGIPDTEGGADRWSVDHLLLDQHARPTFVEVKRSSDRRLRREVVGQMLDYAANAQAYWPVDRVRALAADRYGGIEGLDEVLRELLVDSQDLAGEPEAYWDAVDENLRTGNVRLLFVADELPRELRRVIEFLNEQMPRIEVLGVEVRQYVGANVRALVPRLVGQTESARQTKRSGSRQILSQDAFLSECGEPASSFFSALIDESRQRGLTVKWGTTGFSLRVPRAEGRLCSLLYGYRPGVNNHDAAFLQAYLGYLDEEDDAEAIRRGFLEAARFTERGEHTLDLPVTEDSLARALKVRDYFFSIARDLSGS